MNARRARGLSQEQLAERLGVSRVWVGQIERGKASPRLDLVLRTLNELEITLSVSTANEPPPPDAPSRGAETIDIDAIADTNVPARQTRRRR
jgi:HTH-type transcriptional regulator/antitoxin HipB